MGKRVNTAVWLPNQNRWQIKVQKDGVRKTFTSAKPGRTGQREANHKADLWLDEGISSTRLLVETAYVNWIAEVKMTTSQSNWKPIESRWRTWVQPDLGKKQIANLNEQMLQAVVNKAFAAGLSKKTLMSLCADLRAFCKWLRLGKLSTFHPEELHVPKGARSEEKKILQPDALRVLFAVDTTLWRGEKSPGPVHQRLPAQLRHGIAPGGTHRSAVG